jgi:hypothetical protein
MENREKKLTELYEPSKAETFELDTLLHPASAFAHPMDVVRDADLTLNKKRAILASWASDACAVEAAPELRANASDRAVRWDEIMDALRMLDDVAANYGKPLPHYKRVLARAGVCCDRPVCVRANGTSKVSAIKLTDGRR